MLKESLTPGTPKPRPRGTGKLHSSTQGVGLALLRLEHVEMVLKGEAAFELDALLDEGTSKLEVMPWRPSWWPNSTTEHNSD